MTGEPPSGDNVHDCDHDGCDFWAYSRLAVEFHELNDHDAEALR